MLQVMDALKELKDISVESLDVHFLKYYKWLERQATILREDSIIHLSLDEWKIYSEDQELKEKLYSQVKEYNAEGALCIRMGSNIARVLRKEVDPLHLMFGQDNLLADVYSEMV